MKYTSDEVQRHNTTADLWVVIDNKVYDLSNYADEHPGGSIILSGAGCDCSVLFHHYHIIDKEKALAVLSKKEIGDFDGPLSPVMGAFYTELSEVVGEVLRHLPRHPIKAKLLYFIDVSGVIVFTTLGVFLWSISGSQPTSAFVVFIVSFLTCVFSNRTSAQAHCVGHLQIFDKSFVAYAEMILLMFGGRPTPVYSLPSKEVAYRLRMTSSDREYTQAEFAGGRGPFEHQALHHVRGASLRADSCAASASMGFFRLNNRDSRLSHLHYLQTTFVGRNVLYAVGSAAVDMFFPLLKLQYLKSMLSFHSVLHPKIIGSTVGFLFELAVVFVSWFWPALHSFPAFVALMAVRQWTNFMILFFAQHVWDSDVSESVANTDWGKYNTLTSVSLHGESLHWWHPLFLGGNGTSPSTLTYHLEHTLFPGVNYIYLAKVAELTEAMCSKHNIR
jgi:hypothetical protein